MRRPDGITDLIRLHQTSQQRVMDLHPRQFARLNLTTVRSADGGTARVVNRNFSVDPRTITLDRLHHLLARALDIRQDFTLLFHRSREGVEVPLTCDWDLEGALSEEPRIDLTLQLQPQEPGLEEWDIICPSDVPMAGHESIPDTRKGSILEQVFQFRTTPCLTESEFQSLSDCPCPLRYAVYRAEGAEPHLRPTLWMHLLDVFPSGVSHSERQDFLNSKAEEYYNLRHCWKKLVHAGTIPPVLRDITSLVLKDVRRTDRPLELDERALYNVLTTYAVHHPSVGYCQGMSDLLSPILHVMRTEARSYVAFCALMGRMRDNFRRDGRSIRTKFRHLRRALRTHDPQLHAYLSEIGALDLLFCYRWLLLDLKREFPYDEMLNLQEILWSTLRPVARDSGVQLFEVRFPTPSVCQSLRDSKKVDPNNLLLFTDNHFGSPKQQQALSALKRWALQCRRQSIARIIESDDSSEEGGIIHYYPRMRRRKRKSSRSFYCKSWSGDCSYDKPILNYSSTVHDLQIDRWLDDPSTESEDRRHGSSDSNYGSNFSEEEAESEEEEAPPTGRGSEGYTSGGSQHTLTEDSEDFSSSDDSSDSADTFFSNSSNYGLLLPPPDRFGDGKPFLVFTCLAMILNHRDVILSSQMDANEIGIYFDRLVRKHRLSEIMPRAKQLFVEYLRSGWTDDD